MIKRLLYCLTASCLLFPVSCQKIIEEEQKQALFTVMTNGHWQVEKYIAGDQEITSQFKGYNFYFKEDGTVNAVYNSVTVPGTWTGNLSKRTITSSFPAAGDPLEKLNGTWTITDSEMDYVQARIEDPEGHLVLHLRRAY